LITGSAIEIEVHSIEQVQDHISKENTSKYDFCQSVYSDPWYAQHVIHSLISLPGLPAIGVVRTNCSGEFNCLDACTL